MYKYSINVVWSDEDECYIATIPEFTGLSAFGDTQEGAIQEALVALEGFIEIYKEDNVPIPIPKTHKPHSGQTRLRLPKSLHAILVEEAKNEGVSLNTYIIHLLSERNIEHRIERKIETLEEGVQNLYNQQHVYYFLSNEGSPQIQIIETGSEHSYQLESIEFDEKSVH